MYPQYPLSYKNLFLFSKFNEKTFWPLDSNDVITAFSLLILAHIFEVKVRLILTLLLLVLTSYFPTNSLKFPSLD